MRKQLKRAARARGVEVPTVVFIKKNEYVTSKKVHLQKPPMCSCSKDQYEGRCSSSNCFNFATKIECCPETCVDRMGRSCSNCRFSALGRPKTQIFYKSDVVGFGICASEPIPADSLITEYVGEVIDEEEMRKRLRQPMRHYYIMHFTKDLYIDAKNKGGPARFLNHSCQPNCRLEKWQVGKCYRLGVFAERDLAEGEELTIDYKFDKVGNAQQIVCQCESLLCNGWLGDSITPGARENVQALLNREKTVMHKKRRIERLVDLVSESKWVVVEGACCRCGKTDDLDQIILCDGPDCNSECHMKCMSPPMTEVPRAKWYCDACKPEFANKNKDKASKSTGQQNARQSSSFEARWTTFKKLHPEELALLTARQQIQYLQDEADYDMLANLPPIMCKNCGSNTRQCRLDEARAFRMKRNMNEGEKLRAVDALVSDSLREKCPDVEVKLSKGIVRCKNILFTADRDAVHRDSKHIVDQLGVALTTINDIGKKLGLKQRIKYEVCGHTHPSKGIDPKGSLSMDMSKKRAVCVMNSLIQRG
eukprot:g1886.t1